MLLQLVSRQYKLNIETMIDHQPHHESWIDGK